MQELLKDLAEVFNKHGLLVLKDSAMLSTSPICIEVETGFKTRDVTISFREIVRLTDEELKKNIDECGLIMEM